MHSTGGWEERRGEREGADASQPLLLINHQKSLPQFMAFDPSSSFALRGRVLGRGREGSRGKGESQGPEAVEVRGGEIRSCEAFRSLRARLDLIQ